MLKGKVFRCFQGEEKWCIGNEWVKGVISKFVTDTECLHIDSQTASHYFKLSFLLKKFLSKCENIQNYQSICSHLLNRYLKANVIFNVISQNLAQPFRPPGSTLFRFSFSTRGNSEYHSFISPPRNPGNLALFYLHSIYSPFIFINS